MSSKENRRSVLPRVLTFVLVEVCIGWSQQTLLPLPRTTPDTVASFTAVQKSCILWGKKIHLYYWYIHRNIKASPFPYCAFCGNIAFALLRTSDLKSWEPWVTVGEAACIIDHKYYWCCDPSTTGGDYLVPRTTQRYICISKCKFRTLKGQTLPFSLNR